MCISRTGYAARLLFGLDIDQVFFDKKGKEGDGYKERLDVCGPGYTEPPDSEIKTLRDECGGDMYNSYRIESPNVWYETSPFYFGDSRWGATLYFNPFKYREIKILNFPKKDETAKIRFTARYIGIPIFYTFGSKELGKDGISFRIGWGPAGVYYDPIEINSGGKKLVKKIYKDGTSFLLSFDWGYYSMYWQAITTNPHRYEEFKNEYNERSRLLIGYQIFSFNYVWSF